MTRDDLRRLRAATLAFRDALVRDREIRAAAEDSARRRRAAAESLDDALRAAALPPNAGFSHGGIVVWWEEDTACGLSTLAHVLLARIDLHGPSRARGPRAGGIGGGP